jgi:hypothetical protein
VASRRARRASWRTWVLAASLLAAASRDARGEPSAADKETARSLLNEGDRKRDAKDLRGALGAYLAADAIMGVPTTAIEVAKTEERLGLLVEARDTALRIARLPVVPTEPRAFQLARAAAERLASDLALRVPSIRVIVRGAPPEDVAVQFDDAVIPKAAAGMPRKVNPGKHVVAARADGYERASAEVLIAERENRELELVLAPSKEPTPNVAKDERSGASAPPPAADQPPAPSRTNPLVYVGGSVAAAGVLVGSIAGIAELRQTAKAEDECGSGMRDACSNRLDTAHRLATLSNVSLGIGALGAAVAIFALMRPEPPKPRTATFPSNLQLVVQPGAASVIGTF